MSSIDRRRFLKSSAGAGLVPFLGGDAPRGGEDRATGGEEPSAAGGPAGVERAQEDPPNVLLIISDDQRWTDFSFMGHPAIDTPRVDQLATQSAVFPNGYVPTSLCRASLATLLTGLHASQHRICCNDPPQGIDRSEMLPFLQEAPALPRLLKEAGYRSLQTGKFWEGHYRNAGFTDGMTTEGRHGGPGLRIGRETMEPIWNFLDDAGEDPWFIWYAPFLPHAPHNPPARLLAKYDAAGRPDAVARYWAMCEWFDETVGTLLDRVEAEDTLVLFLVDNGWIQSPGETPTTRGGFGPKSKLSPYDGGVRTPLMIRWPGRVEPGYHRDLVSTVDVAPTILGAAGLEPTAEMPGLDLVGELSRPDPWPREAVHGEIYTHDAQSLEAIEPNVTHQWIRRRDWKGIRPIRPQKASNANLRFSDPQLYHLGQDPYEETDLAERRPERIAHLTGLLEEWAYSSENVAAHQEDEG